MKAIRALFYKLCSIKDKGAISSGNFEKLAKVIKVNRNELALMFIKHAYGIKSMDIIGFVNLLEHLKSKLSPYSDISNFA